ncbi:glycosyltransferase [Pseudonocardia halophobica]|uniref:glycosyltransferase n=1 Tax=Pseudonocardia halophobica TaxID=29401 RepID=UPI003D91B191
MRSIFTWSWSGRTTVYVRHRDAVDRAAPLPGWAVDTGVRPLVLVSLGTVFHRTSCAYEAIIEALAEEQVVVGVALGADQDPARLGPLPPHLHVEPALRLTRLLDRCVLLVTHGGFNSVKEAMSRGVPMVIMLLTSDQHLSPNDAPRSGRGDRRPGPAARRPRRQGGAGCPVGIPVFARAARRLATEMAAAATVRGGGPALES